MYKIKQKQKDFIVNEITNIKLKKKGNYSIILLKKKNYTTEKAVQTIANKLNIPRKFISYAGNKDKVAITTQYISIKNVKIKELELKDIRLDFKGYLDKPVLLGDLKGNEFVIKVISNKTPKKITKMINYFGEQRFSKNNKEIGKLIVKRDFKRAVSLIIKNDSEQVKEYLSKNPNDYIGALRKIPLKILKLYVHSYQSYLWNEMVVKSNVKYIPIIGFGTKITENIKGILEKEEITTRDFIIKQIPELSSEGVERNLFVKIKNLKIEKIKKGYIIRFTLPKGSYATEVIKQIFPG